MDQFAAAGLTDFSRFVAAVSFDLFPAAEIPPNGGGTLASFKRVEKFWHGHEPYVGERRYVMFTWMTSPAALDRELGRHRFSAKVKRLNPFA